MLNYSLGIFLKIIPLGLIFKLLHWLYDLLFKKIFFNEYLKSHEIWMKNHRLGASWSDCGGWFEYSLYLPLKTDSGPRIPKIAIRSNDRKIKSIDLLFEAKSGAVRYQEHILFKDINSTPIINVMSSVPYQDFLDWRDEQWGPSFLWSEYRIKVFRIVFENGEEIGEFSTGISHLTHTWFLNSTWDFRWGRFWNLDVISWAKKDIKIYWIFGFSKKYKTIYVSGMRAPRSDGINIFRLAISYLMTRKIMISLQFWVLVKFRLFVLNDNDYYEWRWARAEVR